MFPDNTREDLIKQFSIDVDVNESEITEIVDILNNIVHKKQRIMSDAQADDYIEVGLCVF